MDSTDKTGTPLAAVRIAAAVIGLILLVSAPIAWDLGGWGMSTVFTITAINMLLLAVRGH